MADFADTSAQLVEDANERALAGRLARLRIKPTGTLKCLCCGEDIPPERRRALEGVCTRIDCQTDLDRQMARRGV